MMRHSGPAWLSDSYTMDSDGLPDDKRVFSDQYPTKIHLFARQPLLYGNKINPDRKQALAPLYQRIGRRYHRKMRRYPLQMRL